MNNPMPRTDSLLARLMAKKTTLQVAKELDSSTNLTPTMEKKANEFVAKVLDDASSFESDSYDQEVYERESEAYQRSLEGEARYVPDTPESTAPLVANRAFVLPDESVCGLWDSSITLDESQNEAVRSLKNQQYGCLIGAAGTGKTTVQKYLLKEIIYSEDSTFNIAPLAGGGGALNIAMVSFTGMAVHVMKSNLPEWMHGCCKTIHSLLEFEPEDYFNNKTGRDSRIFLPQRNSLRKLDIEFLLIDEASMVGLDLWMMILAALKPGCRIIMTGDLNQLPPIIGQPVFAYALSKWHVSELTTVHRQKEAGANRIVEVAHEVLNGKSNLTFDVLKGNPNWRVIYNELDKDPIKAAQQIINILNQLRQRPIDPNDPESPMLYNPHKDRVMTAGNGFDTSVSSAFVQQAPLNERLSLLIEPPTDEHPRFKIDAGRAERRFSVNNRVMATKNEPPSKDGRVTNGLAGNIINIVRNGTYKGNPLMFGPESEVEKYIKTAILQALEDKAELEARTIASLAAESFDLDHEEGDSFFGEEEESKLVEDKSGMASHSITVRFDTGAERTYSTMAAVESIQLAYCSTVAKCQGSQFDTAIIICHHAQKNQLSREWLYTAITRGAKRVIILGTDYAVRYAISRQKIKGRTLEEKIQRYQELLRGEAKTAYGGKMKINVPLSVEDYDGNQELYETVGGTFGESA